MICFGWDVFSLKNVAAYFFVHVFRYHFFADRWLSLNHKGGRCMGGGYEIEAMDSSM